MTTLQDLRTATAATIEFKAIQTFFADPQAVNNATDIMLTSLDIFVKEKPSTTTNVTGSSAPGIVVSICEVTGDEPDLARIVPGSTVRVAHERVYSYSDSSVPTIFAFATPVVLQTNRFYGIVISPEDSTYEFWVNKTGDRLVGTNTPSSGSGNTKDGKYYLRTNAGTFAALNDTDLKYRVNVAKFSANTINIALVNKDYEFLTVSTRSGAFMGGELVYQREANATGNVAVAVSNTTIIGSGTDFTTIVEGGYIAAWNGTSNAQVLQVQAVTNATHMTVATVPNFTNTVTKFMICPVGKMYHRDEIKNKFTLVDSSSNSTLKFDPAATIIGDVSHANAVISTVDDYVVDQFVPKFLLESTETTTIDLNYVISTANAISNTNFQKAVLDKTNRVTKYPGAIMSRSNEVAQSGLYGTRQKSGVVTFTMTVGQSNTSLFNVPRVRSNEVDFFVQQNKINNIYLNGSTDTEIFKGGLATSKYISAKSSFSNNRFAEDLRVYMTAHRPVGTSLLVYTKLHNSNDQETFDDKYWTPLSYIQNANTYSSNENPNDLIEYELALPSYPETEFTVSGSFTSTLSSDVITAGGFDPSANIAVNNLVKLYNPLIPQNYTIAFVTAANSTTLTLSSAIANNNVVGAGYYLDKLRYTSTAFLNNENGNVARYFTLAFSAVDKFDSMQFKVVMLSNSTSIVPTVEEIQAIGINAGT